MTNSDNPTTAFQSGQLLARADGHEMNLGSLSFIFFEAVNVPRVHHIKIVAIVPLFDDDIVGLELFWLHRVGKSVQLRPFQVLEEPYHGSRERAGGTLWDWNRGLNAGNEN